MIDKIVRYLWGFLIRFANKYTWYPLLYRCWWHFKFRGFSEETAELSLNYMTGRPHPGAGIGHQLANYIAGYSFSVKFGLQYAHSPFPNNDWESFLGFGLNETHGYKLVNENGYKRILLPLFNEYNLNEVKLIKNIINSFKSQSVLFVLEQDQFYEAQYEYSDVLRAKFHSSNANCNNKLLYNKENFNVAIHVRRGDVNPSALGNDNIRMRWQDNEYFCNVLKRVVSNLGTGKPIKIFLFSQGQIKDFGDFAEFKNLTFCLDMDARSSFFHLVSSDVLITSKSSFSYKPALLNGGLKIAPRNFWHSYPKTKDWILVEDDGTFETELLAEFNKFE